MTPQAGLYCAVVTGFLISALRRSTVQIGGPTGAFVVVVSGIIAQYGLDDLFTCNMMAGVLLVVMGLTGTGTAVRFIPRPVVLGFTNGIALVIASTQLKDLFGIPLPEPIPAELVPRQTHRELDGVLARDDGGRRWRARFDPSVESARSTSPGYVVALVAGTVPVSLAAPTPRCR
jgi:SulP family sulfate permease